MEPLDDRAREALESYRASISPPPAEASGQWNALLARAAEQEDEPTRRSALRRPWLVSLGVATAAAAVLALTLPMTRSMTSVDEALAPHQSASVLDSDHADAPASPVDDAPRIPTVHPGSSALTDDIDPLDEAATELGENSLTPEPLTAGSKPVSERKIRARRTSVAESERTTVAPHADEALRAEARLLAQARSALVEGRLQVALSAIRDHRARFPQPNMQEEFAIVELQALCRANPKDFEPRRRAFEQSYPHSPLRVHIPSDCPNSP